MRIDEESLPVLLEALFPLAVKSLEGFAKLGVLRYTAALGIGKHQFFADEQTKELLYPFGRAGVLRRAAQAFQEFSGQNLFPGHFCDYAVLRIFASRRKKTNRDKKKTATKRAV